MHMQTEAAIATDQRYPVGKFQRPEQVTTEQRENYLATLAGLPDALRAAVSGLSDAQLDTPYRDGGWTVRQLVHHVADSHEQMVGRMKLALTEDCPKVKTYDEAAWAALKDARTLPIELSLGILDGLHTRAVVVLRSLSESEWQRCFDHPEWGKIRLEQTLALYAWHSRHHVAHVTELRKRMGW
jgi:uncharacterized damage-inducible protein DinB